MPSDDLLAMISNDSPTDLPPGCFPQQGMWNTTELFGANGRNQSGGTRAVPQQAVHANGKQQEGAKGGASGHAALPLPRGRMRSNSLTVEEDSNRSARTREEEQRALAPLKRETARGVVAGETYYLIDMVWWKQWHAWVGLELDDTDGGDDAPPAALEASGGGEAAAAKAPE